MLILDFAHDLLENVLERYDAGRSTKLVDHHRQVTRTALEVTQLPVQSLPLRHKRRRPNQGVPILPVAVLRQGHEHVLGVQHPDHGIRMIVIHENAGVL